MARRRGPLCAQDHSSDFQRRLYYRSSDADKHRYRPYAWVCLECGELHDVDPSAVEMIKGPLVKEHDTFLRKFVPELV